MKRFNTFSLLVIALIMWGCDSGTKLVDPGPPDPINGPEPWVFVENSETLSRFVYDTARPVHIRVRASAQTGICEIFLRSLGGTEYPLTQIGSSDTYETRTQFSSVNEGPVEVIARSCATEQYTQNETVKNLVIQLVNSPYILVGSQGENGSISGRVLSTNNPVYGTQRIHVFPEKIETLSVLDQGLRYLVDTSNGVFIIDYDGRNLEQLPQDPGFNVRPYGDGYIYERGDSQNLVQIFTGNLNGYEKQITSNECPSAALRPPPNVDDPSSFCWSSAAGTVTLRDQLFVGLGYHGAIQKQSPSIVGTVDTSSLVRESEFVLSNPNIGCTPTDAHNGFEQIALHCFNRETRIDYASIYDRRSRTFTDHGDDTGQPTFGFPELEQKDWFTSFRNGTVTIRKFQGQVTHTFPGKFHRHQVLNMRKMAGSF